MRRDDRKDNVVLLREEQEERRDVAWREVGNLFVGLVTGVALAILAVSAGHGFEQWRSNQQLEKRVEWERNARLACETRRPAGL